MLTTAVVAVGRLCGSRAPVLVGFWVQVSVRRRCRVVDLGVAGHAIVAERDGVKFVDAAQALPVGRLSMTLTCTEAQSMLARDFLEEN